MKPIKDIESEIETILAGAPHILGNSGPKTVKGKQRVAMNGVTHGLTGQNVFLEEAEYPAYMDLGAQYIEELRPVGVRETQLAQKIIDLNWRLNTISCIENNLFQSARLASVRDNDPNDDRTIGMVSKASAWQKDCAGPNCFEKIGRHETRLQRSLLKMTQELERFQAIRLGKGEDTFVAADCKALQWYRTMTVLHTELAVARLKTPATAAAAASGSIEYAFANDLLQTLSALRPLCEAKPPTLNKST